VGDGAVRGIRKHQRVSNKKNPVLQAPKIGEAFKLYIAASGKVVGAMLSQEKANKEVVVAYLSRRLLDAQTRYTCIEKLCLSLYYACSKFSHYLLASPCTVVCRHDIM
jgi:hypothetical protein